MDKRLLTAVVLLLPAAAAAQPPTGFAPAPASPPVEDTVMPPPVPVNISINASTDRARTVLSQIHGITVRPDVPPAEHSPAMAELHRERERINRSLANITRLQEEGRDDAARREAAALQHRLDNPEGLRANVSRHLRDRVQRLRANLSAAETEAAVLFPGRDPPSLQRSRQLLEQAEQDLQQVENASDTAELVDRTASAEATLAEAEDEAQQAHGAIHQRKKMVERGLPVTLLAAAVLVGAGFLYYRMYRDGERDEDAADDGERDDEEGGPEPS